MRDSEVCRACDIRVADRLAELPGLWVESLTPTRMSGQGGGTTNDPDDTTADYASEARDAITDILFGWCVELEAHRIPLPALDREHAAQHLLHHAHLILDDQERPDLAAQLVRDIDAAYVRLESHAYPARPKGQLLGICPACSHEVRAESTGGRSRCPGCGDERTIEGWHQVLIGDLDMVVHTTAADLAAWLTYRYRRNVTRHVVGMWASRGVAAPGGRLFLHRIEPQPASVSGARYDVASGLAIAERLYGQHQQQTEAS